MGDEISQQLLANVQQIANEAPREIEPVVKCAVKAASQAVASALLYGNRIEPLADICRYMRNGTCISLEEANRMLDQCPPECINHNRIDFVNALTGLSTCNQHCIEQMEQAMQATSNSILRIAAVSGFVFIVIECIKLLNFWDAIKDAGNFVASSAEDRKKISETLKEVAEEIKELSAFVEKTLAGKSNDADLREEFFQINLIRDKLHDVQMEIRNLEVEIDRKKVRLVTARNSSKTSMVTNITSAVSTFFNTALFSSSANNFLVAVNYGIAAIDVALTVANAVVYKISNDDLVKIGQEMKALNELEQQRRKMESIFDKDVKTLRDANRLTLINK